MDLSAGYLQQCAADTGFPIATLEKVSRLGEVAENIARHPFLRERLLLKGGTALNLCFGPPSRLSVDLDYNYVGCLDRKEMLRERPLVEAALDELVSRLKYHVQTSADGFAGHIFYLNYMSVLGGQGQIKVDLNYMYREPLPEPRERELWQPGDLDRPMIRTVSKEELCVGKMLALLDRMAVRDAWDVGQLPSELQETVQTDRYRAWFIGFSVTLNHPLGNYCRSRIEEVLTPKEIEQMLAPLLVGRNQPDPQGLFDRMWIVMEPLLVLKESEKEYIAGVQQGKLRPDLVFPGDPEKALFLERHPSIKWKLQNVIEHLNRLKDEGP